MANSSGYVETLRKILKWGQVPFVRNGYAVDKTSKMMLYLTVSLR